VCAHKRVFFRTGFILVGFRISLSDCGIVIFASGVSCMLPWSRKFHGKISDMKYYPMYSPHYCKDTLIFWLQDTHKHVGRHVKEDLHWFIYKYSFSQHFWVQYVEKKFKFWNLVSISKYSHFRIHNIMFTLISVWNLVEFWNVVDLTAIWEPTVERKCGSLDV
jgi:hypothetical protein